MSDAPLAGIRVVEFGQLLAAPNASMILGHLGEGGLVAADHLAAVDFDNGAGGFFGGVGFEGEAGDGGSG